MPFDVAAIQQSLRDEGLDGWLLYDFHGSNPIAARMLGTSSSGKMTTRRWFYLVPSSGEPRGLVHAIERHTLDALPGRTTAYAGRQQLEAGLTQLLGGMKRVAMEYSPECAIPYVSRVDAGTAEAVKARGVEIVSSGDLVQAFEAVWTAAQLESHRVASQALYRIKDKAFAAAAAAVRAGTPLTEYELHTLGLEPSQMSGAQPKKPVGCDACRGRGYKGRMGIFEMFLIDDEVRHMINNNASTIALRQRARELGMRTLREDGVRKVLAGLTTAEEVITTTMTDLA